MVEGKHSHQMLLSSAMDHVASHGAHSEQVEVEVCVEERVRADLDQDSEQVVEVCVEERADLEGHHCQGHQDQHLTKETLVNQVA